MKHTGPKLIGQSLSTVLNELGLSGKVRQYQVLEEWPKIVGEQIARVAIAQSIINGRLIVNVTRSTWRNELTF